MSKVDAEALDLTAEEIWRQVAEGLARQEAQWEALAERIRKTVQDPEERERLLSRPVYLPPTGMPRRYAENGHLTGRTGEVS